MVFHLNGKPLDGVAFHSVDKENIFPFQIGDWVEVSGLSTMVNGVKGYALDVDKKREKVKVRFQGNGHRQTEVFGVSWVDIEYLKQAPMSEDTWKELIDMALDLDDAVWFYELVERKEKLNA